MYLPVLTLILTSLGLIHAHDTHLHRRSTQSPLGAIDASYLTVNNIPYSTRAYWMRFANAALPQLSSPCPFAAFATAIVNHTYPSSLENNGLGKLVCIGINENSKTGNPTLHGEIAAITNCTSVLTDPNGEFNMTATQAQAAFADLSLYTNAESCPMVCSIFLILPLSIFCGFLSSKLWVSFADSLLRSALLPFDGQASRSIYTALLSTLWLRKAGVKSVSARIMSSRRAQTCPRGRNLLLVYWLMKRIRISCGSTIRRMPALLVVREMQMVQAVWPLDLIVIIRGIGKYIGIFCVSLL